MKELFGKCHINLSELHELIDEKMRSIRGPYNELIETEDSIYCLYYYTITARFVTKEEESEWESLGIADILSKK